MTRGVMTWWRMSPRRKMLYVIATVSGISLLLEVMGLGVETAGYSGFIAVMAWVLADVCGTVERRE